MRQLLNLLPVSSDKPPNAIGFLIVLAVIIFGPSQLNCLAENLSEKVRPNIVLINLDDADREPRDVAQPTRHLARQPSAPHQDDAAPAVATLMANANQAIREAREAANAARDAGGRALVL